jgi:predicted DNA-binding protein with PD1-like motif
MKAKLIQERNPRTYALVFDVGEEVVRTLLDFAGKEGLHGSHLTAIGAFREATLGFFDWERKTYQKIPIREQVEVLSFVGNVAEAQGKPALHAHVVLGKADGTAHGGHLMEGYVRPTLEVVLLESPAHLRRRHDEQTGLALLKPDDDR